MGRVRAIRGANSASVRVVLVGVGLRSVFVSAIAALDQVVEHRRLVLHFFALHMPLQKGDVGRALLVLLVGSYVIVDPFVLDSSGYNLSEV